MNKQLEVALNGVSINGQKPQNAEDCKLILSILELNSMREQCASYWNDLIAKHGAPQFYDLDQHYPEQIAANYIPLIQHCLDWFSNEYEVLKMRMETAGLPWDAVLQYNPLDSEIMLADKIMSALEHEIPKLCDVLEMFKVILDIQTDLQNDCNILQIGKRRA